MDREQIIKLLISQMRSADLWIAQWNRYKDASSVKNVAMALGKIQGVYNVLLSLNGGSKEVPLIIIEEMDKYGKIWDSLGIEK